MDALKIQGLAFDFGKNAARAGMDRDALKHAAIVLAGTLDGTPEQNRIMQIVDAYSREAAKIDVRCATA